MSPIAAAVASSCSAIVAVAGGENHVAAAKSCSTVARGMSLAAAAAV